MEMPTNSEIKTERNTRIIMILLGIICVFLLIRGLHNGASIIIPFILAGFLLYIVNPIIEFFERFKVPSGLAVLLSLITIFTILVFLGVVVNNSIQSFVIEFPKYENRLHDLTSSAVSFLNVSPADGADVVEENQAVRLSDVFENLSLPVLLRNIVKAVGHFMSSMILVLLILLFMLGGRNQLKRKAKLAFNPHTAKKLSSVVSNINIQIQQYILMKTAVSLLTTVLVVIIMLLFGLEFVVIWGVLTFMLNFIPNVGSMVAVILPLSLALIQFDNIATVGWLGLCLFLAQFSVGQVLEPKLVGKRIHLSPVVILFALIFWGAMWGVVGMVLAVPLTVAAKIVFENVEGLRFLSVLMSSAPPVETAAAK